MRGQSMAGPLTARSDAPQAIPPTALWVAFGTAPWGYSIDLKHVLTVPGYSSMPRFVAETAILIPAGGPDGVDC